MKCRQAPSRYYGTWGDEGLCRECIQGLEPATRRKVLRELRPEERKRWQIDELAERVRKKEQAQREASQQQEVAHRIDSRYTNPYRAQETPACPPPKLADGRSERRRHTRTFAELQVRFYINGGCGRATAKLAGRAFRSTSKDISEGGIRLQVHESQLLDVPAGCGLRLEIALPFGIPVVRCTGVVRNVVRVSRGRDTGYLCIQFAAFTSNGADGIRSYITHSGSLTAV
jgi:hypothetical protein